MYELVSSLDRSWIALLGLLALRIGAVLLFTPVLYAVQMPFTARVLVTFGLACILATALLPTAAARGFSTLGGLVGAALSELALGITLAVGVHAAFAAFAVAGRVLDVQIGFATAQILDPMTQRAQPVVTSILGLAAVLVFFLTDTHHLLIRGLASTVERYPVGEHWPIGNAVDPIVRQVGVTFALGFALVAPVVLCLLLTEAALGVLSRSLPQMNMFALGLPVRIIVGLLAVSLWWAAAPSVFLRIYETIFRTWERMLIAQADAPLLRMAPRLPSWGIS